MLPCERGHSGLTHSKPPPVLMQVVPRLQLCCWLRHSSTSAGTPGGMWEREARSEPCQANSCFLLTAVWAGGGRSSELVYLIFLFFPFFVTPPTKALCPEDVFSLLLWEEEVRSFIPRANALSPKGANERVLTDNLTQLQSTVPAGCHLQCMHLEEFPDRAESPINILI